jgi:hypothetical protein
MSGETSLTAGAEGATAPETLRQKNRVASIASGKRRSWRKGRYASADGIILSGKATDGAFVWFPENGSGAAEGRSCLRKKMPL